MVLVAKDIQKGKTLSWRSIENWLHALTLEFQWLKFNKWGFSGQLTECSDISSSSEEMSMELEQLLQILTVAPFLSYLLFFLYAEDIYMCQAHTLLSI